MPGLKADVELCCLRIFLNLSDHGPNPAHLWCIIVSLTALDHVAIFFAVAAIGSYTGKLPVCR